MLADGARVDLGRLGAARVVRLLGQGGQGFVYEVRTDGTDGGSDGGSGDGADSFALKWYRPESATRAQYRDIRTLTELGPPHPRFLWPLTIARVPGLEGFGYVMPLRKPHYIEFAHLLSNTGPDGEPLDVTFATTIVICRQLALAFLKLHAYGLCYRDISFGNVFFDPDTGDTLICDNDNVGVDNGDGRVLGTPFFMAPEVVADGTFSTLPNTDTDRHSLAVLIFYTLCMGHPLEGRRTEVGIRDHAWLTRHFGTDPVFCMDPDREDNRPADLVRTYWNIYPTFLRRLFVQAFVEGATTPSARVTEGEWMRAMDHLRDVMTACVTCGTTCFWDVEDPDRPCRRCGTPVRPRMRLAVGRHRTLALSPLQTLRTDHVGGASVADRDTEIVGAVVAHPDDPHRWGLRNLSSRAWVAIYAGDQHRPVEPGATVELQVGLRLRIGDTHLLVKGPAR